MTPLAAHAAAGRQRIFTAGRGPFAAALARPLARAVRTGGHTEMPVATDDTTALCKWRVDLSDSIRGVGNAAAGVVATWGDHAAAYQLRIVRRGSHSLEGVIFSRDWSDPAPAC